MAIAPSQSGSRVVAWVAGSALYRIATTLPGPERPVLEDAATLHTLRRIPHGFSMAVIGFAAVGAVVASCGFPAAVVFGAALALAALLPVPGLLAVPLLLLWGPRLSLTEAGGEALFVRLDQAVVVGLLLHMALHPKASLRSPPAHSAFLLFLIALLASIVIGLLQGTLTAPVSALLYLAQWLEWYGLYVAAWNLGPRLRNTATYAWALPLLALAAYGMAESLWPYPESPDVRYRTFERVRFPGQANHAAGLFAFATATGLALAASNRYRVLGLAVALCAALALFPTGSRSGLVAWMAGLGALLLIRVPVLRWWLPPAGAVALFAVPSAWWSAVSAPGSSMYDRLVAWKSALSTVASYPVFGLGVGARHRSFYDNHYIMTLAESGIVGLALLILFLLCLGRALAHGVRGEKEGAWWCAGALAGLAALAVHGLATATFVVTLTAGPCFWFCGIALSRPGDRP